MNRKKKQEVKEKASTRQLMGITDITPHSLVTGYGELVFFKVKPTNISVLSEVSVGARIYALMNVLKGIAEIEMLCLNSRENFEKVKSNLSRHMDVIEIMRGLHFMCIGAEAKFFNGHSNVSADRFIVLGVKGLLQASRNVKNALLFNVLSYMSDKLLTEGNTTASIDERYLFLTNLTAIEYIRNFMKRVRKKESAVILASQNLEDFAIPGIAELTKPLFSIPTHAFLFNAGNIDKRFYMDTLQLEESE